VLLNKVTGFLLPGHLSALVRPRRALCLTRWIAAPPNACCKASSSSELGQTPRQAVRCAARRWARAAAARPPCWVGAFADGAADDSACAATARLASCGAPDAPARRRRAGGAEDGGGDQRQGAVRRAPRRQELPAALHRLRRAVRCAARPAPPGARPPRAPARAGARRGRGAPTRARAKTRSSKISPSSRLMRARADALVENLTVFEMLLYTAEMKVDMRVPFRAKCRKVQAVVDQLALNTCRDTRIGSQVARGISGARPCRRPAAARPPCLSWQATCSSRGLPGRGLARPVRAAAAGQCVRAAGRRRRGRRAAWAGRQSSAGRPPVRAGRRGAGDAARCPPACRPLPASERPPGSCRGACLAVAGPRARLGSG